MKAKLELHVEKFRVSQTSRIENVCGKNSDSPMYFLASKSVTEACSWVMALVRFIETTYRDYERAKFSTYKAWHVTTRLATKLIAKVYVPRHGIVEKLKIGDARSTGKNNFLFYSQIIRHNDIN